MRRLHGCGIDGRETVDRKTVGLASVSRCLVLMSKRIKCAHVVYAHVAGDDCGLNWPGIEGTAGAGSVPIVY